MSCVSSIVMETDKTRAPAGAAPSLSDAEGCEQLIEHALVVHPAGDLAERIQRPTKIARNKFRWPRGRDPGLRRLQADPGLHEEMRMAHIDRYPLLADRPLHSLRKAGHHREHGLD